MGAEPDTRRRIPTVVSVVAAVLAGVLTFVLWPRDEGGEDPADFQAFEAGERDDAPAAADVGTDGHAGPPPTSEPPDRGSVVVLEDRVERGAADSPASAPLVADPDAGEPRRSAEAGWVDPVNEEVLGSRSWMAELPEEERDDIDRELDEPAPEQFPLDLGVRREGIEVAKAVVFDCYDALRRRQPGRTGRIIVSFDVVASGAQATLENTAVPTNVKLDDARFERCIIEGIDGLRVPAADEGEMHVEYPFLFDIEGKR